MSYYQLNRQEILQKVRDRYCKKKVAEYYLKNKDTIKERSRNRCKNLSKEEKDKIKKYQRETSQQLIQYKNEVLQSK